MPFDDDLDELLFAADCCLVVALGKSSFDWQTLLPGTAFETCLQLGQI